MTWLPLDIHVSDGKKPDNMGAYGVFPNKRNVIVADRGVQLVVAKNFDRLNARSSNSSFWGDAANSVGVEPMAGAEGAQRGMAVVVVRKRGVRLHWLGGDVRATGQRSAELLRMRDGAMEGFLR